MRTGGAQPRAPQAGESAVAERVRAQGAAAGCRSLPVGGQHAQAVQQRQAGQAPQEQAPASQLGESQG